MGMVNSVKRFWNDESGISSVEYALLLALIAAGIAVAAGALGDAVDSEIQQAADCINSTNPASDSNCGAT